MRVRQRGGHTYPPGFVDATVAEIERLSIKDRVPLIDAIERCFREAEAAQGEG